MVPARRRSVPRADSIKRLALLEAHRCSLGFDLPHVRHSSAATCINFKAEGRCSRSNRGRRGAATTRVGAERAAGQRYRCWCTQPSVPACRCLHIMPCAERSCVVQGPRRSPLWSAKAAPSHSKYRTTAPASRCAHWTPATLQPAKR